MTHVYRALHLVGATDAEIRVASFEDRDHVVIPCVMLLGNSVIHASTASEPELVPAEEIILSVPGWNGRPVTQDHPSIDGARVSANIPEVLEQKSFGRLFNAKFESNRLLAEAWLDPVKAKAVGRDAERVLERALNGEPVEISVGCFVTTVKRHGIQNGKKYFGAWSGIIPDHLAMLPEGTLGACSVEMGCGAPRVAMRHLVTADGLTVEEDSKMEDKDKRKSLRERLRGLVASDVLDFFRFRGNAEGLSDGDVRSRLNEALFNVEPAFLGVDSVFSSDGKVIYAVMVDNTFKLFRRSFTENEGMIELADDREQVEMVTSFEAVSAITEEPIIEDAKAVEPEIVPVIKAACECEDTNKSAESAKETKMDPILAARLKALIAASKGKLTEADEATLATASEATLVALEASFKEPEPVKVEVPVPVVAEKKDTVEMPKDELLALQAQVSSLQGLVARETARDNADKTRLVNKLKQCGQTVYDEAELNAMSVEQLTKLASLAKIETSGEDGVDFGARFPAVRTAADVIPPPIDITARIKAARAAQK